ncbi:unnamed protein product [Brugia timori]|uniref:RAB3GAP2_N domain-containing protein n=1 Tax=Brugia timori TaxID=42155 RepID=A0A0R3QLB1_9BILA|nr:unnamed protein product [Brugia timori]
MSLLLEYLNQKDYEYYLGVGYADSCVSTMVKIESDFRVENMLTIVQSLHGLHFYKQSKVIMHEPAVIRALQAQDIRCSFGNMHPVLIGLDLNVTIIVNFDSTTNLSRLVSGYTDIFLTTIDMGRGLLHFVHQNNNDSLHTGHEVLQIKTIDSGMRIMKIRSEEIHMKFSQLLMDPSGTYAFYTVPEKNKQQSVYQMKVDYPNFTLDAQKTSQEKAKIFAVNQDDRILPVDRNALVVWKFAGEKRSAWLYEGRSSQRKKSFHQIGCILSGINDPTGRLSIKIHRIRRHL